MLMWSQTDLAYLAGFIDGEGTICIFGYHGRRHSALRVAAYNTNRDVLDWIALTFGGRVYAVKRRPSNRRQSFVWQISARPAVAIIDACMPYFRIKAQQAKLFVEVASTLNERGNRTAIKTEVLEYRRKAAAHISALNRGEQNAS
jgi:hypothetical protein